MTRREHAENIKYFWEEKGDPTRYTDWNLIKQDFPGVLRAWQNYQDAKRLLDFEVRDAVETADDY